MLRDELREAVDPVLEHIKEHPFWTGLRTGTLPGVALAYFAQQDAHHLLPVYGRALARCAARAQANTHAQLLGNMATGVLEKRDAMALGFDLMAEQLGVPVDDPNPPIGPTTHAYTSFFMAASAESLAAGLGSLLPCAWLYILVADDLRERHDPEARYAAWVEALHPGEDYREILGEFIDLVDEVGKQVSATERDRLRQNFDLGARYELAFVDAAWHLRRWPV